jgi:hypothetical protein
MPYAGLQSEELAEQVDCGATLLLLSFSAGTFTVCVDATATMAPAYLDSGTVQ